MKGRLQSLPIVLGALLAGAAAWAHWLTPADPLDPFQGANYLRSLEPMLLLAGGLSFASAIMLARHLGQWAGRLKIGLALALALAGAVPAARLRFAALQALAGHRQQLREEEENRRAVQRRMAEAAAEATAHAKEVARLAAVPLPASSMKPCDLPETCPANETCFAVSGDYGLGPHGPVMASGGDHRCHQTCDHHPCNARESCERVLIRASDTGGADALLCLTPGLKEAATKGGQ